jgi:hypothetical protein
VESASVEFVRVELASVEFSPSDGISLGGRRRFAEMVARNKSTMTIGDAPSGGSGRTHSDLNVVIGTVAVVTTFFFGFLGFYSAIKSDFHRELDGVVKMLESKLDGQDRKLDGHKDSIAAQERKVENLAEKSDLQYFKYILSKNSWSWFGLNSYPVKEEEQSAIDVVSKVADNLNTKFEAIHNATEKFGTEIKTMRKQLNNIRDKPNAKTKDGISSGSNE